MEFPPSLFRLIRDVRYAPVSPFLPYVAQHPATSQAPHTPCALRPPVRAALVEPEAGPADALARDAESHHRFRAASAPGYPVVPCIAASSPPGPCSAQQRTGC